MGATDERERLLSSPDAADRIRAARLLSEAGKPDEVLASLWMLLKDSDKTVRAAASDALARLGEGAIPLLREGLRDPDWVTRYRSLEALGKVNSAGAVDLIAGMLRDPRDHVRYMAAKSLLNRVPPSAVGLLKGCLEDDNFHVRKMAVDALASAGSEEADGVLLEHLHRESSEEIRSRILAYLHKQN